MSKINDSVCGYIGTPIVIENIDNDTTFTLHNTIKNDILNDINLIYEKIQKYIDIYSLDILNEYFDKLYQNNANYNTIELFSIEPYTINDKLSHNIDDNISYCYKSCVGSRYTKTYFNKDKSMNMDPIIKQLLHNILTMNSIDSNNYDIYNSIIHKYIEDVNTWINTPVDIQCTHNNINILEYNIIVEKKLIKCIANLFLKMEYSLHKIYVYKNIFQKKHKYYINYINNSTYNDLIKYSEWRNQSDNLKNNNKKIIQQIAELRSILLKNKLSHTEEDNIKNQINKLKKKINYNTGNITLHEYIHNCDIINTQHAES